MNLQTNCREQASAENPPSVSSRTRQTRAICCSSYLSLECVEIPRNPKKPPEARGRLRKQQKANKPRGKGKKNARDPRNRQPAPPDPPKTYCRGAGNGRGRRKGRPGKRERGARKAEVEGGQGRRAVGGARRRGEAAKRMKGHFPLAWANGEGTFGAHLAAPVCHC